ncbi:MAG: ABC transporter permease [Blastocatellia bacterium]
MSPADFLDWREQARSFESLSAYNVSSSALATADGTVQIYGAAVMSNFFEMLGIAPLLGRTFAPEEGQPGTPRVVIVSYDFWRQRLGGRPDVIGQALVLSDVPCTIIGVLGPGYRHPEPMWDQTPQYWRPWALQEGINRKSRYLRAVGRLKQGVAIEQAQAEMNAIAIRLEQAYPESNTHRGVSLTPLHKQFTGDVRLLLLILQGAVGFVLLIACVNVANLLLARMAAREQEMAIRAALGAGHWRLVRLLLTECFLLALLGGAAGLLLARWGIDLLISLAPREYFRLTDVRPDGWSLIFTMALSLFTVLLFGLAPGWQAARINLNEALSGSRQTMRGGRLRGFLVVTEVALALVLLLGAGLMLRSLAHLQNVRLGFNPDKLLTMQIIARRIQDDQIASFYDRLLARVETLPGVESAAITYSLPMTILNNMSTDVEIVGRADSSNGISPTASYRSVSPGYFRVMGVPLLSGRMFNERDSKDAAPVIMINEVFARRFLAGGNPIGQKIVSGLSAKGGREPREIVGVVASNRHAGLQIEPEPEIYVPYGQDAWNIVMLAVRTEGKPERMATAVQSAIWELNRGASLPLVRSMDQILWELVARPRFNLLLFGVFALVALVLATMGVYSVMSYTVAQTKREIGIRMALGAQPRDVLRLVIRQGMALTLLGIALGLLASFGLARLLQSMLFGVSAADPLTFAVITILLAFAALSACWIPAWRATKVDPMITLRCD